MLRELYVLPKPEQSIELRAFTHGLMPRTVPAMVQHFVSDWQNYGVDAWNRVPNHWLPDSNHPVGWWTLPEYLGDQFIAPLLGAPPGTCILQPNAHWIVQCLLSSRELFTKNRNKVVLTEGEFPSVLHSVLQWADLYNLDIELLPLKDYRVPTKEILASICPRTALVLLSHVGFTTGEKITDSFIRDVSKKVHATGGHFVLDGYHSLGATSTPVTDLEVDVYLGGLLKEGSGSSGNAFVYIREGVHLTPRTTGWFGDKDPFAFNVQPATHPEIRMRFKGGTSAIASFYHAVEGIRILLHAGLERIRQDSLQKTDYCIQRASQLGMNIHSPLMPQERSAMFIASVPKADLLSAYLKSKHIYTDSRKGHLLRMAPFVWNTMEELKITFDNIAETLQSKSYLTHTLSLDGPVT